MTSVNSEAIVLDLVEVERCALNETFRASGLNWCWDQETHASLRRVGDRKRQIDEYGCRTGELVTYEQLMELHQEAERRVEAMVLTATSEHPEQASVA